LEFRYRYNGMDYTIQLEPRVNGTYTATIGDHAYTVEGQPGKDGEHHLLIDGARIQAYSAHDGAKYRAVALVDREARVFELERVREQGQRRAGSQGGGSLEAQMPGQVRQVLVNEGDTVESGQPLLILEAMKMEIRISAPHAGIVARLLVREGQTVERGQQLAEIEAAEVE
jgi:3-methylcrotonyl-CoA carboxylase alpha subunit